jgi:hypothetical protein
MNSKESKRIHSSSKKEKEYQRVSMEIESECVLEHASQEMPFIYFCSDGVFIIEESCAKQKST